MVGRRIYLDRIARIRETFFDAVFPRFCVSCGFEGALLCSFCEVDWTPRIPLIENGVFSSLYYADPIVKSLIRSWKYSFDNTAFDILSRTVIKNRYLLDQFVHAQGIEAVVPIPLYSKRFCERGFDQAGKIARMVSEQFSLPVSYALKRVRSTGHQTSRINADRKEVMKSSPFQCIHVSVPSRILLVDDVWTTGSTADAAKRVLLNSGCERVFVYSLARG